MDYLAIAKYVIYEICGGQWCGTLNRRQVPIYIRESLSGKAIGRAWTELSNDKRSYTYWIELVRNNIEVFVQTCGHEAAHILCSSTSNGRDIFKTGPRLYEELLCDLAGIEAVILLLEEAGMQLSNNDKLDIAHACWDHLDYHLLKFRDYKIPNKKDFERKTLAELEKRIDMWLSLENAKLNEIVNKRQQHFKVVNFLKGIKFLLQAYPENRPKVDPRITEEFITNNITVALDILGDEIEDIRKVDLARAAYAAGKQLSTSQRAALMRCM